MEKELSALEMMEALENGEDVATEVTTEKNNEDTEVAEADEVEVNDESETEVVDDAVAADDNDEGTTSSDDGSDVVEDPEDSPVEGDDADEGGVSDGSDDGSTETSDELDYRKKYEELTAEDGEFNKYKSLYEELSKEFKANGRMMKGITDPEVIRLNLQKGLNYDRKMAQLKPAKPVFEVAAKRGWIDNPDKLNRLIDIEDGNVEALKELAKEKGIELFELDLDKVDYKAGNEYQAANSSTLDDMMDNADILGIQEDVGSVLNAWDDEGLYNLDKDPDSAAMLMKQIQTGAYADVMKVVDEIKAKDYSGMFSKKNSMDQYVAASHELKRQMEQDSYKSGLTAAKQQRQATVSRELELEAEKEAMKAEYEAKLAALENAKIDKQREKATSVSRPKGAAVSKQTTKKEVTDATTLSGDEFMNFFNSMGQSDD